MELYEVIDKRRTIRDFSGKEITEEVIRRILEAGLKAPSGNHMREIEFVVFRGKDAAANIIGRVTENTKSQLKYLEEEGPGMESSQKAMYVDALPKQYRMLVESGCLIIPFYKQRGELLQPTTQSSLNDFASVWMAIENVILAATDEGLVCTLRIPVGDEAAYVTRQVNAPQGYVMPCYLSIGYAAENAVINKQVKIDIDRRIHYGTW